MQRRGIRCGWLALVALAISAMSGCGEDVEPPIIHDLAEPWQPVPIQLDNAVYTAIEAACRETGMAQGGALAVIDARGADTAIVVIVEPNAHSECLVAREAGAYGVSSAGGTAGGDAIQPVAPREIANVNVSTGERMLGPVGSGPSTYIVGQAGADVGVIDLALGDGRRVRASLWGRGWFAAWWPGEEETVRFEVVDKNGVLITPP